MTATRKTQNSTDLVAKHWEGLPAADKISILGHDRMELSPTDRTELLTRMQAIAGRADGPRPRTRAIAGRDQRHRTQRRRKPTASPTRRGVSA